MRPLSLGLALAIVATLGGFLWRYVYVARHSSGRTQQRQLIQAIFAARALLILGGAGFIGTVALGQVTPAKKAATAPSASHRVFRAASASGRKPTRDSAVKLVNHYYAAHPKELKAKGLVVYQALGTAKGRGGVSVKRVGGYVKSGHKMVQRYEFWVYPDAKFERVK